MGEEPILPMLCLTATAKSDVVEDILKHFRGSLGVELTIYDGGSGATTPTSP